MPCRRGSTWLNLAINSVQYHTDARDKPKESRSHPYWHLLSRRYALRVCALRWSWTRTKEMRGCQGSGEQLFAAVHCGSGECQQHLPLQALKKRRLVFCSVALTMQFR